MAIRKVKGEQFEAILSAKQAHDEAQIAHTDSFTNISGWPELSSCLNGTKDPPPTL
jgi:hypothetical protein